MSIVISPLDTSLSKMWKSIPPYIKVTASSGLIIGLLIHIYVFTNYLPNHDGMWQVISTIDGTTSGRWFSFFPAAISSAFSLPWVNGMLSLVYISVAACFVVSTLKITNPIICFLTAGLMVSIPSVTANFCYLYASDASFFGLMLACLAAFLVSRYKYGFIFAIIPLTLALGTYQAWYPVTTGILVAWPIMRILRTDIKLKSIIFDGIKSIIMLAISLVAYLIIVKLTTLTSGLSSYMGINQIGQIPLSDLPGLIYRAYSNLFSYFFLNKEGFHYGFMFILFIIASIVGAILITRRVHQLGIIHQPTKLILLLILLALFPLACNLIYVMTPLWVHHLMIYGTVLIPIFLLAVVSLFMKNDVIDRPENKTNAEKVKVNTRAASSVSSFILNVERVSVYVVVFITVICILNYGILANKVYFKLNMAYEQTYAQSVSLVAQAQSVEGYTRQTEIILVGQFNNGEVNFYPNLLELNTISVTGAESSNALLSNWYYDKFIQYFMGIPNPITSIQSGIVEGGGTAAIIAQMPSYPDRGSVAMINGKIYIKLSDPQQ